MRSPQKHRRFAFSALQLVIVLAILLLALAMLLPIIQRVREAASRSQSTNNLKQIALAMHSYHDTLKVFPPAVGENAGQNGPAHFHILPFIEQQALLQAADGASWKNGTYGIVIEVYVDPRDTSAPDHLYKNWLATTSYPVNWMVTREGKMRFTDITDGTSNTLMFAQRYRMCNGQPTAWGYPSIHTWAPMFAYYSEGKFQSAPSQDQCDPMLAQSIGRDILVALCDGSVRTVAETISPTTWYYLCDPADGNPIPVGVLD
jgi:type II secretory pathway pseudopilin PulG